MKYPNWLYLTLVIGWTGGLFLLLMFLFLYAFQWYRNYSDFYSFSLELALGPFMISLATAKIILSRRYTSPEQRKLLSSILFAVVGIILVLSGVLISFLSFFLDPVGASIGLIGFILVLHGLSLALPGNKNRGVPQEDSTLEGYLNPSDGERSDYLPAAGVVALLATILTALITLFSLGTPLMFILGFPSSVGIVTGAAATSSLLKGRYQITVPLGLLFLTIPPLLIFVFWAYWFPLALPILALCASSIGLTAWNQKYSMKASDWRTLAIFSAGLGAIALASGILQYANGAWNACQGSFVRPYLNNAGLLLSLAATGITFALISLHFAREKRVEPIQFLPSRDRKRKRSMLFQASIVLLTASIASTTLFSAALIGPSFNRCNFGCGYTIVEQVDIIQVTFGPLANQTTFTLSNSGTSDVNISYVRVQGGSITNSAYASQLSTSTICAGANNKILVATFPGVTFVKGTTYSFQLTSTKGDTFPYSVTA
jgi:hypothetical protein